MPEMKVNNVPIGSITPYENNPRNNNDAVEATANSIKEFGWQQPIVVDKDNVIIVGHTRLKAAKSLGLDEVPVLVADQLSDEQVKAYRLADNKVGELADWDFETLDGELSGITDIDMEDFGFKFDEDNHDGTDDVFDENIPDEVFALNVVVKDEAQQEKLYAELIERGLDVKVVNI